MASLYSDVLNISITASGWTAVSITGYPAARAFLAKARDNSQFLISNESDGSGYISIAHAFADEIDPGADKILFYVKGTTTTTLEVLLRRK